MNRKVPIKFGWILIEANNNFTAWRNIKTNICALSSLIHVKEDHLPLHWEWLLSFSIMGKERLTKDQVKFALEQFGASEFEEDNHEPGIARKFFMAVDPQYRVPCPCKDEIVIRDGDYEYSVKKDQHNAEKIGH